MNTLTNRFATPLTLGLFAVSAISGVALFFHLAPGAFHEMHEWLSMVLLLPFLLHVWKNWKALVGYARRGWLVWPVALALVAGIFFAVPAMIGQSGGNPAFRASQLLTEAPLTVLASVLKTSPDALQARLKERGYQMGSETDSLAAIAAASGKPAAQLLNEMITPRSSRSGQE